jgi:hypothetical protein
MKKQKIVKILMILTTIFIVAACNLPFNIGKKNQTDQGGATEAPFSLGLGTKDVDPNPVGIQAGLGSFDSYQITLYFHSLDSNGNLSDITEVIERSVVDNNSHSISTQTSFDPEYDTENDVSTSEEYIVGNVTCTGSDAEGWTYEEMTAQEKEMMDIYKGMVDVLPLIDDPEFAGEETVNGIDCNHFTFQVAGIGDTSGSVANVNTGDYWLAKDGQYIVKYHLILQVQSAADGTAEAETSDIEVLIDLNNVNIPPNLVLPANCYPGSGE